MKTPLFEQLDEETSHGRRPRLAPLSREAKGLRRRLTDEYHITDEAGVAILRTALEAFDRMRSCQRVIARDGLTVTDRWGQVKPHPLIAAERDARAAWLAGLKQLNLDLEPLRDRDRPAQGEED